MVRVRLAVSGSASTLLLGLTLVPRSLAESGGVGLLRDRWEIPNVFAETDEGAVFGLGWATEA